MSLILEAVKTALSEGRADVSLKEAAGLTGSGTDVGGRVIYDQAFAPLRYGNPFRMCGAREITTIGSEEAFVVKTGNATVIQTGTTNPWGYSIKNDVGNYATSFWQISQKSINAVVPVRTAIMSDINGLDETIVSDMALEFAQQEALSMMFNNDLSNQSTPTPQTGGASGLRGLNFYSDGATASFGTSGSSETNGRHVMKAVTASSKTVVAYNDLTTLAAALPSQYWMSPNMAWMMHPNTIQLFRQLKDTAGFPVLFESGDDDGGSLCSIFGFHVMPNPYMDQYGAYKMPIYLAAWDQFMTIADNEMMSIQRLEQYQPGFISLYAEKRVCSTIRDVFAGVRLNCPA